MSIQPIIVDEEAGESYQGLRMTADEYMALPETKWYYELIDGVIVQMFWGDLDPAGDFPKERPIYHGLRMTADEYWSLGETFERYELVNGVVIMSPSPTNWHQMVGLEIAKQLSVYLDQRPVGIASYEVDVEIRDADGQPVIYRPDIIFIAQPRSSEAMEKVTLPPDLVVEVISPHSRPKDTITKRQDYEHSGVLEYWLIDPLKKAFTFYRLHDGHYQEIFATADRFESQAVPGFVLDLKAVRRKFEIAAIP
jgi:Uma2 family endonuclease